MALILAEAIEAATVVALLLAEAVILAGVETGALLLAEAVILPGSPH